MKLLLRLSLFSPIFALAYATTLTDTSIAATTRYESDTPLSTAIIDALSTAPGISNTAQTSSTEDGIVQSSVLTIQGTEPQRSLESEIQALRRLELEVQDLYSLISEQKSVIHDLAHASFHAGKDEIKQCETAGCVVKKVLKHAKMCMHLFYVRYGPIDASMLMGNSTEFPTASSTDTDRSCTVSRRLSIHSLGLRSCPAATDPNTITSHSISKSTASLILDAKPHETLFSILAVLGTVFSLACIAKVIHHCHNDPRLRAERASRKEERRKACEYRRAARWQAIRNFWSFRQPKRTGDYEEKRSLILAQENVLEGVMQQEITQLRLAHGIVEDIVHAAEEGRVPTVDEISRVIAADGRSRRSGPPTYRSRSRASSMQPPSYHTSDEEAFLPMADGFDGYVSNGADHMTDRTDVTPASSVINLSPRNSSETLRTAYSAL